MFHRQERGISSPISTPKCAISSFIVVERRGKLRAGAKVRPKSGARMVVFVKCLAWRFAPTVSERSNGVFRSAILFHVRYVLVFFVINERR
jgi:hypothetical protein